MEIDGSSISFGAPTPADPKDLIRLFRGFEFLSGCYTGLKVDQGLIYILKHSETLKAACRDVTKSKKSRKVRKFSEGVIKFCGSIRKLRKFTEFCIAFKKFRV